MISTSSKDEQIQRLQSDLVQRDACILEQESSLVQKDAQIEELSSRVAEKSEELRLARNELVVQSSRLKELDRKLAETTLALDKITATKSWRWTAGFRLLLYAAGMLGTDPERFSRLALKGIAVLRYQGFAAFCEKSLRKLKRIHLILGDDLQLVDERSHSRKTLYDRWIEEHEPANESENKESIAHFAFKPKISVIVPVYNVNKRWLDGCVRSVLSQQYENWELLLSDDGSTRRETLDCLKLWSSEESRIVVSFGESNQGISAVSNRALKMASGEFIALLDHDDLLSADALYEAVKLLNDHPETDIIYSDEDKIVEDQSGGLFRFDPHFKSEWDPQLLLASMYIGHLTIYRKILLDKVGSFRPEYDFAQDYDLALRCTEVSNNIKHIPKVLYHWRALPNSHASGGKPFARKANIKALESAVRRRKYNAEVLEYPFANRVKFRLEEHPLVSIIIPTDDRKLVLNCIHFLVANTNYPNFEIVPVTNSKLAESLSEHFGSEVRVRPISFDKPFNFSLKCNEGAASAGGNYLLFLNDDIEAVEPNWLEDMMEVFGRGNVGGVCPKLYYEDGTIQYSGMATGVRGLLGTPYHQLPKDSLDGLGRIQQPRLTSVLTAACLLIPKSIFWAVGGFDAVNTPIMDSDVDFSFKIREQGYDLVYQPFASLRHRGHASIWAMDGRPGQLTNRRRARLYCLKRWGDMMTRDPYFSDNIRHLDYETDFKAIADRQEDHLVDAPNVLLVSQEFSLTGAPLIAYNLARYFRRQGYFVAVMCPFDGPLRQKYVDENIPVIIDRTLAHHLSPHPHTADLMGHFDIIIANTVVMWRSLVVAHQYGVPSVWFIHESFFGLEFASWDPETSKAFDLADDILLYGKNTEEIYKPLVKPGKIKRVVLGTEAISIDRQSSTATGPFSIVHVGSIEHRKGQDILVESFLKLPQQYRTNIVVSFVGNPIQEGYCEKLKKRASGESGIKFLGPLPQEEVGKMIGKADALVCTSREETGPLVVLEAMAAGKAVISTNVGSVEEMIVDKEHGLIVPTDDPTVLTERIQYLYDNRSEVQRLGENARSRYLDHFTLEHMAEDVLSVIKMRLKASGQVSC
jgi:O-antigen biosynthesis protein